MAMKNTTAAVPMMTTIAMKFDMTFSPLRHALKPDEVGDGIKPSPVRVIVTTNALPARSTRDNTRDLISEVRLTARREPSKSTPTPCAWLSR